MIPDAREVRLKPKIRKVLEARCRAPTTAQRDVRRARIVLLAAPLCRPRAWWTEGPSTDGQEAGLRQGYEPAHFDASGSATACGLCPLDGAIAGQVAGRR